MSTKCLGIGYILAKELNEYSSSYPTEYELNVVTSSTYRWSLKSPRNYKLYSTVASLKQYVDVTALISVAGIIISMVSPW